MQSPEDVHRAFVTAWNQRDWTTFRALLHPDYTYTGADGKTIAGPDAGLAAGQMFAAAFPNAQTNIVMIHRSDSTSVGEFVTSGDQTGAFAGIPPTGRHVTLARCNIIDVRDGLVYRERDYTNLLSVMIQLGVIPAPGAQPAAPASGAQAAGASSS